MASSVTTRQADEAKRTIKIIGDVSHQIVGAKLPSNKQVLQMFFYHTRFVNLNVKESANLVIDAVLIFWQQARIPTRQKPKCSVKLLELYKDWENLQKTSVDKMTGKTKIKYDQFVDNLDNLFDIAHGNALEMMRIEEDKAFLIQQRMKGRPGAMLGVDKKLADKESRSKLREEREEERRLKHIESSKMQPTSKYF